MPIIESNTTLQELILSRNDIGDKGTESLAIALQKNTTLTKLDLGKNIKEFLGYNDIHAEGMNALAMMLQKNKTLVSLNLGTWIV